MRTENISQEATQTVISENEVAEMKRGEVYCHLIKVIVTDLMNKLYLGENLHSFTATYQMMAESHVTKLVSNMLLEHVHLMYNDTFAYYIDELGMDYNEFEEQFERDICNSFWGLYGIGDFDEELAERLQDLEELMKAKIDLGSAVRGDRYAYEVKYDCEHGI